MRLSDPGILDVLFGVSLTIGLVVLSMLLLTFRDRRASRAQAYVLERTWSRETMGLIGMRVICGPLSRRSLVILDVLPCPREQLWLLLEGVAVGRPRGVEILIHATLNGRPLTIRTGSEPAPLSGWQVGAPPISLRRRIEMGRGGAR
jgi:hypothetical protein